MRQVLASKSLEVVLGLCQVYTLVASLVVVVVVMVDIEVSVAIVVTVARLVCACHPLLV